MEMKTMDRKPTKVFEAGPKKEHAPMSIDQLNKERKETTEISINIYTRESRIFAFDELGYETIVHCTILATMLNFPEMDTGEFIVKAGARNLFFFLKNASAKEIRRYGSAIGSEANAKGIYNLYRFLD
jgi:hypothetical protein